MRNEKKSVDLSQQELDVIEAALRTQEKILSVQSRADVDGKIRARLDELKQVLKKLDRQSAASLPPQGWSMTARSFFG